MYAHALLPIRSGACNQGFKIVFTFSHRKFRDNHGIETCSALRLPALSHRQVFTKTAMLDPSRRILVQSLAQKIVRPSQLETFFAKSPFLGANLR
jgi:hypothetical protein